MQMQIEWQPRSRKDFARLDAKVQQRVVTALERLARTGHGDVKQIQGTDPPERRLRVGDWRVRFRYDADAGLIVVLRVLPRGEAYR